MKKFAFSLFIFITLSCQAFEAPITGMRILVNEAIEYAGEIEPSLVHKMIENEEELVILDIREANQKGDGEIFADDTYAITRGDLEFEIGNNLNDKNILIVTYCRAGNRGALAAQTLKRLGYKNAKNLKGGLRAWADSGYPIETALGTMKLVQDKK